MIAVKLKKRNKKNMKYEGLKVIIFPSLMKGEMLISEKQLFTNYRETEIFLF